MSEQKNQNLNNEKEDKISSSKENYSNGKSNINDDHNEKTEIRRIIVKFIIFYIIIFQKIKKGMKIQKILVLFKV